MTESFGFSDRRIATKRCFHVLETTSSEIACKVAFNKRFTKYVPDFLFVLFFIFIFLFSTALDVLFVYLILRKGEVVFGVTFLASSIIIFFVSFFLYENIVEREEHSRKKYLKVLYLGMIILHLEFIFLGLAALKSAFEKKPQRVYVESCLFLNISKRKISTIKIYWFVNSVLKCVPQLLIVAILLLLADSSSNDLFVAVGLTTIFLNMVIFSLGIAILFPIRKTPKIFSSWIILCLNFYYKFIAALCSSGSLLLVFAQTFKSIGSYALLLPLIKILLFSFPNWHALKFECQSFANEALCLWVNFPLLCTASSCVYIHPFADRSELYYYILYLIDFILDIFFLYTFTSCGDEYSILLLCKGILFSGFISLFGLINILNQKKVSKGDSTRKV